MRVTVAETVVGISVHTVHGVVAVLIDVTDDFVVFLWLVMVRGNMLDCGVVVGGLHVVALLWDVSLMVVINVMLLILPSLESGALRGDVSGVGVIKMNL